jgi:hypothetical protein
MIQTDWKLGRTEERCATCGHAFAEGETYVSALFELPSSDFRRGGYCERCYPPSDGEPFSFWRTRRSAPVRSKKLNHDQVKELFLRFVGSAEPADREVAYHLALHGETRWLVLESNLGEGPFPVADPVITAERLEALDREIRDLLVVG